MRWFGLLLLLSACGYHFEGGETTSVSIPYVIGDEEGGLTAALIHELSQTPHLRYSHSDGQWILSVKVLGIGDERIGFRYERNPDSGKLRKHLQGIENRNRISAEVVILSAATEEIIYGPHVVTAEFDFDYVDPNSLQDLSVLTPAGRVSTEFFSLGQLDTIDAAKTDVLRPLYLKLAQKIIDGLTTCCD